jgi:hypothetical protein
MKQALILNGTLLLVTACAFGQSAQRQAQIRGGGGPDQGKCTIEVYVDGAVEVQITGANATLRTTQGQPAQWRRFECTSVMPANPANFHFAGVDGRGSQQLIRDPRNGGTAVVRIEDPESGAEGYTFDLTWSNGYPPGNPPQGSFQPGNQRPPQNDRGIGQDRGGYREYPEDQYRPNYQDTPYYRRYGHGYALDDAVQTCRAEILRQATRRFRGAEVHVRRTFIDDQPGRNDYVVGSLDVHRGPREERYNFFCSADFNEGRIRSAQIDLQPDRY